SGVLAGSSSRALSSATCCARPSTSSISCSRFNTSRSARFIPSLNHARPQLVKGKFRGGEQLLSGGTINARGVTVTTHGASSRGVRAGLNVSPGPQAGLISLTDSTVMVSGADAIAAEVAYGGTLSTTRTSLSSVQGVGVSLFGNATVTLDATQISAGQ